MDGRSNAILKPHLGTEQHWDSVHTTILITHERCPPTPSLIKITDNAYGM